MKFLNGILFAALLALTAGPSIAQQAVIENCTVVSSAPTYTAGSQRPCTQDTSGNQRVVATGSSSSPLLPDIGATGTAGSATTLFTQDANGYASVYWSYSSVGSGNVVETQSSTDNSAWTPFVCSDPRAANGSGAPTRHTPVTSTVFACQVPQRYFRLVITTYGSGTVTTAATFKVAALPLYMARSGTFSFDGAGVPTAVWDLSNGTYQPSKQIENGFNRSATGIPIAGLSAQCDDTSPQLITENQWGASSMDCATHALRVTGDVASGATDSGKPLKIGGVYQTTLPTLTAGQRGDIQIDAKGNTRALIVGLGSTSTDGVTANVYSVGKSDESPLGTLRPLMVGGYNFNGSTYDRDFACPNSAQATVTAGNTTQLVALASSQIIRVCSYQVGIATTGTFSFAYGTGSNCGTGTTTITPATTLTAGNVVTRSDPGSGVLRTIASNALCLAAVTGNVQVHLTYAQY